MLLAGCLACCKHLKMVAVYIIIVVTSGLCLKLPCTLWEGGQPWWGAVYGWMMSHECLSPEAPPIPSPYYPTCIFIRDSSSPAL